MKMRNKGKVHPSSSSSSSTPSPSPATGDSLSVLNLLPAAILSLAVVLSVEDREVLAYMITRSIKSTNPNSSKKSSNTHKSPVFECGCFDCYTSYWFRWDTSPNRELIHQAIEAFEENLNKSEQSKKKGKKKDKMTHRRFAGKVIDLPEQYDVASHLTSKTIELPESQYDVAAHRKLAGKVIEVPELNDVAAHDVAAHRWLAGKTIEPQHDVALVEPETEAEAGECAAGDGVVLNAATEESPETTVIKAAVTATANQQNKGLGRKVLPDVTGLLNWRSWSIWSPK